MSLWHRAERQAAKDSTVETFGRSLKSGIEWNAAPMPHTKNDGPKTGTTRAANSESDLTRGYRFVLPRIALHGMLNSNPRHTPWHGRGPSTFAKGVMVESWEVIQKLLDKRYFGIEPKHFGTIRRYSEGGDDPLDGISAYRLEDPAHWMFVTFGFTELHQKTSDNPDVSGWGFELTFRTTAAPSALEPPMWPVYVLQQLARYVFNTREVFDVGHHIAFGGPLTRKQTTDLEALLFVSESELPSSVRTPNGTVKFIQAVGITADEREALSDDLRHDGVIRRIAAQIGPKMLTDLSRGSTL